MRSHALLLLAALAMLAAFVLAVLILWKTLAVLVTGFVCWRALRRQRARAGL